MRRGGLSGVGSSPHTRGALGPAPRALQRERIIPAYAGSTRRGRGRRRGRRDHPRIRGEHSKLGRPGRLRLGSSPHTRGAPAVSSGGAGATRIIPAYAGSTSGSTPRPRTRPDHPRIRGEHKRINAETENAPGSSPHTRGARPGRRARPHFPWIIPAYAGSTCSRAVRARTERDHPRIRGEHQEALVGILGAAGSSPHTRGAPGRRLALVLRVGIIPAYAGSTRSPTTPTSPDWDHPRIRGEHRRNSIAIS